MYDYEKLGVFYLGRVWDAERSQLRDELVLYDAHDLTTHAVCVGMTGSGKTGLGIALLEEAAIDGIPSLVIDPKGDLGNLLLTFPDLAPADFLPWVDPEAARRQGIDIEVLAREQAERWKTGLDTWGQDGARIRRLREAADFAIYTPGSQAGRPVSIMHSLAAPPAAAAADEDLLRDRIASTVTSLLGLLDIDADPLRSREHILLSTILLESWQRGANVDLGGLIGSIRTPPITRVGVMDLETFYPARERFELAMALNGLLAAPGFQAWMEGEPLDVGRLLYGPTGKPRVAIFSIAHLSDAERMFFVSLLLNQTIGWMRSQPGTSSLRALLYIDEILGYLPPVANPPSKAPLLQLMKQARAFGLGVVVATQNPVDLDYRALSNAGTWFIGKLQTEQDRARLVDGLTAAAGGLDRKQLEALLDQLGSRIFLLHDVHAPGPRLFQTRWVMSYLRGPLTRDEIKRLRASDTSLGASAAGAASGSDRAGAPVGEITPAEAGQVQVAPAPAYTSPAPAAARSAAMPSGPPALPPGIPSSVLAARRDAPAGATLVRVPMLLGTAELQFTSTKQGVDLARIYHALAPIPEPGSSAWLDARILDDEPQPREAPTSSGCEWESLPAAAAQVASFARWKRELADWLARTQTLDLWRCRELDVISQAGESERDFRIRLRDLWREERDRRTEALRAKYAPRHARLEDALRRAEQKQSREAEQLQQQKMQSTISVGATLLGAFLGGRRSSIGRATTAARGLSRTQKEARDVERARESVEVASQRLRELEAEFEQELGGIEQGFDPTAAMFETVSVRATRSRAAVHRVDLAWVPHWRMPDGARVPAWE